MDTEIRTIDAYIAQYPEEMQVVLQKLRTAILEACPQAQQSISWQMPTFTLHGNLVHFAVQKHHIGFYPGSSGVEVFQEQFAGYKTTKGGVQLPLDREMPYALIQEVVRWRVAENLASAGGKTEEWTCELCGRTFARKGQSHSCYRATIADAFSGWRADWLPLYEELKARATERVGEFSEHFPTMGVIWKHATTFANVKCRKEALQICFYADRLKPEREPKAVLRNSVNRVEHMVEATDNSRFEEILDWIAESYALTMKRGKKG